MKIFVKRIIVIIFSLTFLGSMGWLYTNGVFDKDDEIKDIIMDSLNDSLKNETKFIVVEYEDRKIIFENKENEINEVKEMNSLLERIEEKHLYIETDIETIDVYVTFYKVFGGE